MEKQINGYQNLIYLPPIDDPQPWIMASKELCIGVLHFFQSFVLNKPISYVKLNFTSRNSPFLKRKPFDISYKIFNSDDFFKWIKVKNKKQHEFSKKRFKS